MHTPPNVRIEHISGAAVLDRVAEVARLHVGVFQEFPYLYDRSAEYEERLLSIYFANCQAPLMLIVYDGDIAVGSSTGRSLSNRMITDGVQDLFNAHGYDPSQIFYLADSVLLPEYRGIGLGVKFFELREQFARDMGYSIAGFCAVQRPEDHPLRPKNYQPLDEFWQRRGYQPESRLQVEFSWKDIGDLQASAKTMQYWLKAL